ncbi:MAG: chemotaxis protein CheB [Syntrophobacteraceae bacterium]
MKVLLLHSQDEDPTLKDHLLSSRGDIVVIHGEEALAAPKDPAMVDALIGVGDCSSGSLLNDLMLGWRAHPHTYLIPCWFPVEKKAFEKACLWPKLAIDQFSPDLQGQAVSKWLSAVEEWQQSRMNFDSTGAIEKRSALELATSLCLRRASGVLSILEDEGGEGRFFFRDGNLISASLKHLRDAEAFYEFLCMPCGGYSWESNHALESEGEPRPLSQLITAGLELIQDSNMLYHFIPELDWNIDRTASQAALDDSAITLFPEQKSIYGLIEGEVSVSQILEASPLSRPSTMILLAKWFSLNDIAIVQAERERSQCRVLIVDDSPLICRALQSAFSDDPRIELAGVAHDGLEALRLIGEHKPDVVTLDLQMPKMDGITTLKHILIRDPKPVVVLSAFTKETSRLTYESFKYGAVDVLTKPANGLGPSGELQNKELCDRVVQASNVQLNAVRYIRRRKNTNADHLLPSPEKSSEGPERVMIVLCGAGGFPSLLKLIFSIPDPERMPLTIIGMDMPKHVVEALAFNLRKDTPVTIKEITAPGELDPGACHLLPNEHSFKILTEGDQVRVEQNGTGSRGHFFDELLTSAADSMSSRVATILLSGAGEDGVEGMRRLKRSGGRGFALSPGSCLRPDLPQKAISLGYASEIKTIADLAGLFDSEVLLADQDPIHRPEEGKSGLDSI